MGCWVPLAGDAELCGSCCKSCPSLFRHQIPPAWIPPGKKVQPYMLWGKRKGRGEFLRLHLEQMKFLQFKGEVIRDSLKALEAVCSFSPGSHPYGNNLGRKKPGLAPSSHPGSWTLTGIRVQRAVPLPTAPQGHSPAVQRAGDGRLEAEGIKQIKQEGERNKFPWTGSASSQMTSSAPLASLARGRQHCSCIFHK